MKKFSLIFVMVLAFLTLKAQILTVPIAYKNTQPISDSINKNWSGVLIPLSSTATTITYQITSGWKPENAILNTMSAAGCEILNWPLYLKVNDSAFFQQPVSLLVGTTSYTITGRNSVAPMKWGSYVDVSHELWYNSFGSGYFLVLAAKKDGTLMKLSEVRSIKTEYSTWVSGYMTVPGRNAVTQSNLWKRDKYNVWINATDL